MTTTEDTGNAPKERESSTMMQGRNNRPVGEALTESANPEEPRNDNPQQEEGPVMSTPRGLEKNTSNYKFVAFDNALDELKENANAQQQHQEEHKTGCRYCYHKAWDNYPRCCALWMRVVLPMFVLMCLAFLGGWSLARFEGPDEYSFNDDIMAARKVVRTIDWNLTADVLLDLPVTCLDNILDDVELNDTEIIINSTDDVVDFAENVTDEIREDFSPPLDIDGNTTVTIDAVLDFFGDVREKMMECSDNAGLVAKLIREVSTAFGLQTAFMEPTFNWVRCWNETKFGDIHVYRPTNQQVQAALSQEDFYESAWNQDFDYWYSIYLDEAEASGGNITQDERQDAFDRALRQASGSGQCKANRAGTSWFFFTIMTTVGYGNQAPVTVSGRVLVATFGFFSILCFGAILANAGGILAVLYEDTARRMRLTYLSKPLWSCFFWGLITALWTLFLASQAFLFWNGRLPPEDVPTIRDSQWFAYISTTTIGLGDFFLEPEVLFLHDTLLFSFIFLGAFTFFAAFLSSLSEFILGRFFPDAGEVLKLRLESSHTVENAIKKLRRAVPCLPNASEDEDDTPGLTSAEVEEEEDPFGSQEALVDLFVRYAKTEKRTMGVVEREEELLLELLARTKKERMQLQYMGARPAINHQAASRNLNYSAESIREVPNPNAVEGAEATNTTNARRQGRHLPSLTSLTTIVSFSLFALIGLADSASMNTTLVHNSDTFPSHRRLASLYQRQDASVSTVRDSAHRLAIIIPFIGQGPTAIPSYLELFCTCAAGSASLVDFLLIHDGVLDGFHQNNASPCPENVKFISLGNILGFSRALVRVTDRTDEKDFPEQVGSSRVKLAQVLAKHIVKYPYVMVEFKPALGHIFQDYLDGYTHWGYSDLDIIFGDLPRWITPDELDDFDIVTYGFGDQERIYLRGQFTFHKNDPDKINQLWRSCEYLSKMEKRFAKVLSGESHLHFESAEGCYSEAILNSDDIKVKYAVKAFTDVHEEDTAYTHGLYVSTGKRKDRTVIYKAGQNNPKGVTNIPDNWFEVRGSSYANPKNLLYKPVGDRQRIPVVEKKDAHCMYWAQKKYQKRLCLDGVEATDTVYWIDGQLFKEKYEIASFPGGISSAPFFHFQEWKRYYRSAQLSGFHRKGPSSTFLLAKEGILPVLSARITGSGSGSNVVVKVKDKSVLVPSPLGQPLELWHGLQEDDRSLLPHRYYCLQSEAGDNPNIIKSECEFLTSWRDSDTVEILSDAPGWQKVDDNEEVTLALTLQIHADQVSDSRAIEGFLNLLTLYLDRWQGRPCVLVLHIAGATTEIAQKMRTKLGQGSDLSFYGLDMTLVGAIFTHDADTLSRKALMNMAIDAAPTRWVVGGYEIERGIILSQDTVFLVHRTAQVHQDFPGSVHIIPQFGLVEGDHDLSVGALELAHLDGNVKSFAALEKGQCEGDDETEDVVDDTLTSHIENLWWEMTRRLTKEIPVPFDEKVVEQVAQSLDRIQMGLTNLLTEKHQYSLYASDNSPILLFDNLGPRNGMITHEMVREVDEFGGKLCYNSLRLAQMATLGYRINVLAGAFATSTPVTRSVIGDPSKGAPGVSRCDGCFFFSEEDDEDVLENLSLDERMRPAKLAILWEHSANPLRGHT